MVLDGGIERLRDDDRADNQSKGGTGQQGGTGAGAVQPADDAAILEGGGGDDLDPAPEPLGVDGLDGVQLCHQLALDGLGIDAGDEPDRDVGRLVGG